MTGHIAARRSLDAAHRGAGYAPIRHSALDPTGRPVRSTAASDDAVASYHQAHAPRTPGAVWSHEPGGIAYPSAANPTPERVNAQIEAKIGSNVARRGTVTHAEGITTRDQNVERTFAESFQSVRAADRNYIEVQPSGTRSPLAGPADSGNPVWSQAPEQLDAFMGSASANGWERGGVPALSARSTPTTMTDLSRLSLVERPRQFFGYTNAPEGKVFRHNSAEVD